MISVEHPNVTIKLKTLKISDAETLWRLIDDNRSHLRTFLGWLDNINTVLDVKNFIRLSECTFNEKTALTCGLWVQGSLAGVVSLHEIDVSHGTTSIGYWLAKTYQGQGIVTCAIRALIAYAFKTYCLKVVSIRMNKANYKSQRIAQRLGLTYVGDIKNGEVLYGHTFDQFLYQVTDKQWDDLSNSKKLFG